MQKFPLKIIIFSLLFYCLSSFYSPYSVSLSESQSPSVAKDYQQYIDFFEEVFKTMEENYYVDVKREDYEKFIEKFNTKIYSQLSDEGKSDDYIRWRSAAYLVEDLKTQEDIFSQFYPPKPAEKFTKEALGQLVDIGIEGEKTGEGFLVSHVEPRSDSYQKGLREDDVLLQIDGKNLKKLSAKEIAQKLTPLINTSVKIVYLDHADKKKKNIQVASKEYFKQSVFLKPVTVPGIFCLELRLFNRETGSDMLRFIKFIKQYNPKGLILDLRGNPGGPPLAAEEISGYFLSAGEEFAYFQKKGQSKSMLEVPSTPKENRFEGPMVILVNKDSGSASELFTGVLQRKGRAIVMGRNTAGQVMLKSMFNFDDQSMVVLITSRGHFPDGHTFSFQGVTPDQMVPAEHDDQAILAAAMYLIKKSKDPMSVSGI